MVRTDDDSFEMPKTKEVEMVCIFYKKNRYSEDELAHIFWDVCNGLFYR